MEGDKYEKACVGVSMASLLFCELLLGGNDKQGFRSDPVSFVVRAVIISAMIGKRKKAAVFGALLVLVLLFYSYPSLKTRTELRFQELPPMFAPDLTLYLNLSQLKPVGGVVVNPYYRVNVPEDGAGYLKFSLAPRTFGRFDGLMGNRTWTAMFLWNEFWWSFLCLTAVVVFYRFLPARSSGLAVLGVLLVMLFNFGVAKTILVAWLHLPSMKAFDVLSLPFMRAFVPIIPCGLLLAYLGSQMEALIRNKVFWILMGILQLAAVLIFPYATLLMAGITAVSLFAKPIRIREVGSWAIPLIYAVSCAVLDAVVLLRGSVGFYENRSPAIHFQPHLLPQLVGGNWVVVVSLTALVALSKNLEKEIKWPLIGLGASNALVMLGDAVVPATRILLSHHGGYFVHLTTATLLTFIVASISLEARCPRWALRVAFTSILIFILVNAALVVSGTYRTFSQINGDVAELAGSRLLWTPGPGDLVITRSRSVDDMCGWVPLMSTSSVLFCTDAEVMLTPHENRDLHRLRQAFYLFFTGENSTTLNRELSTPDPSALMYRLGYWAEAVSHSMEERHQGIEEIKTDLLPLLEKVEKKDISSADLFRKFERIVVIDKQQDHAFAEERITEYLRPERKQHFGDFAISFYTPKF